MLVRHPKVMEKVRAEISALGDVKTLTRDNLRNLEYLQNVLKEGMPPPPRALSRLGSFDYALLMIT